MEQEKSTRVVRTQAARKTETETRKRTPFGVPRQKLSLDFVIEGYHLHWVNDTPGRLHQAELGGYQFVSPEEVGMSQGESRVKRLVGRAEDNSALYAYLMKIEQDLYESDQNELQSQVDVFEEAIRSGKLNPVEKSYGEGGKISRS